MSWICTPWTCAWICTCRSEWAIPTTLSRGSEQDHFRLKESRCLYLTCFTCGAFEWIMKKREKQQICTFWNRVAFYNAYVLNPKSSQLWVSKWNKDVKRCSSNGKKIVILYIRFFLISFVFLHRYEGQAPPDVFPCCILIICFCPASQSCLPNPFPSAPILLLLGLVHLFVMTQISSFPSEKEKKRKKENKIHPFLDSSHMHSWIRTLGRQLGRTQQQAAGSGQV